MKSSARAFLGIVNIQFGPEQLLGPAQTSGGIAACLLLMGRVVRHPGLQDKVDISPVGLEMESSRLCSKRSLFAPRFGSSGHGSERLSTGELPEQH